MRNHQHKASAIMIGSRYFYCFGKSGRVMTAWSLAGAKLFLFQGDRDEVVEKLIAKKKKHNIVNVEVVHA